MKRVLAFILSLIVLSQSFLPCADTGTHKDGSQAQYEVSKTTNNPDSAEDACPPFCQCNCCAGFTINHTIASCSDPIIEHIATKSKYLSEPLIRIALPIWQPPQLS